MAEPEWISAAEAAAGSGSSRPRCTPTSAGGCSPGAGPAAAGPGPVRGGTSARPDGGAGGPAGGVGGGKGSLFDPGEVEELARRGGPAGRRAWLGW